MLPLLMLAAATASPVDYSNAETWLCRPGRADACEDRRPPPAAAPEADCFYVYPTTSMDAGPNSDLLPGIEERGTAAAQFGAFRHVCRQFAPVYRQVTLAAIRARMAGRRSTLDFDLAYQDVLAAWRDYLARDNHGRPFVLIGHSQGSMMLKRLVAEQIDGQRVQARMLSAILPGVVVAVPDGKTVGGDFKAVPLCRSESQTGCVVTWATYRDIAPPPANALFGRDPAPGSEAGCTNPASLSDGSAPLAAIMGFPWWQGGVAKYRAPAGTPATPRFRQVAGLSGECRKSAGFSYLAVHVGTDGPLTSTAAIGDAAYPDWGWHVVDISIVQGNLVQLVARQTLAWRAANQIKQP